MTDNRWGEGQPGDPTYPSRWRAWWLNWCPALFGGVLLAILVLTALGWL